MKIWRIPCKGGYDFLLNRENGKWLIQKANFNSDLTYLEKREPHKFGGLDIIVLNTTTRCNLDCSYCLVGDRKKQQLDFSWDVGKELINKCLNHPQRNITIVYHGSEPLMNFSFIKEFTHYTKKRFEGTNKNVFFSLQTNATMLNESMLEFLDREDIQLSFSLDGLKQHNDSTRTFPSGDSSYGNVKRGIELVRKYGKITFPITVVSKHNVRDLLEIVDDAMKQGFPCIQLTPVEPLGSAARADLSPDPDLLAENFIKIYEENFKWALNGNRFKIRNLKNMLATFFAPTIPNACSICGINRLQVLGIDINGDLYPCDMWFGRKEYSIGNIAEMSIKEALDSDKNFRNYRRVELIRGGEDFPFIRLHTAGCPANSYSTGDIFNPSSYTRTYEEVYTYLATQLPFLIKNKLIDFFLKNEK